MLKAIVFDFDGVLVDSEPLHYQSLLAATADLGVKLSYDEYLRDYLGYDDRDTFHLLLTHHCRRADLAADKEFMAQICHRKTRCFHEIAAAGVPMIPGSRELIQQAQPVLPLAIASGAGRAEIDVVLRGLSLENGFPVIVSADDVTHSKPHPRTYQLAYERLTHRYPQARLEPAQCLAIEDSAAGVASARAAGLRTLALRTTSSCEDLSAAHRVAQNLRDVKLPTLRLWFD
jgi:beta-phosphoglucomutase